MKKRVLAMFLSLCLCVTAVPLETLASETQIVENVQTTEESTEETRETESSELTETLNEGTEEAEETENSSTTEEASETEQISEETEVSVTEERDGTENTEGSSEHKTTEESSSETEQKDETEQEIEETEAVVSEETGEAESIEGSSEQTQEETTEDVSATEEVSIEETELDLDLINLDTTQDKLDMQELIAMETYASSSTNTNNITYDMIVEQCPQYLNNSWFENDLLGRMKNYGIEAMNTCDNDDLAAAEFYHKLSEGITYPIKTFLGEANITDSEYENYRKQVAMKVVQDYLQTEHAQTAILEDVNSELSKVKKGYSLADDVADFAVDLVGEDGLSYYQAHGEEFTCAMIVAIKDAEAVGSYVKEGVKLFDLVTEVLVLQDIEAEAIDLLIESLQYDGDSELLEGLKDLKADIEKDPVAYVLEKYCTDKVIGKIASYITKYALETVIGSPLLFLAEVTCDVIVYVYGLNNPTYEEIQKTYIAYIFMRDMESSVKIYKKKFQKDNFKDRDKILYEVNYNLYLSTVKIFMVVSGKVLKGTEYSRLRNQIEIWSEAIGKEVTFDSYMKKCIQAVNTDIDNGTLTLSENSISSPSDEEDYDSTASIAARFAEIQRMYVPNSGQTWTGNYGGTRQCFGFARIVFYNLFGCDMSNSYYASQKYCYKEETNIDLVGQISGSGVTADTAKNLLQQGKLGDIIQACGATYGQHTMVFVSADDSGVTVYDCNAHLSSSEPDCVIHQWTINWATWASWYGTADSVSENGISLYRASNYAQVYGDGDGMFYDDSVNFVIENGVLTKYNGWQSFVEIPDTVTAIGDSAFENNTTMMTVSIPDSVTSIGNNAFYGCTSLLGVMIPDSVETIGYSAFYNCSKMTNAYLPVNEKFTVVNSNTFYNCAALKEIEIPDSVEKIEGSAFRGCSKLENVKLSNNLKYLGAAAYRDCDSLESIKIPKSLEECGLYWTDGKGIGPFSDCDKLTKIEFEKWTTKIVYGLLAGCPQLLEVEIPDTVTKIEEFAMAYCPKLVKIEIPDSVTEIGNYAFADCIALANVYISQNVVMVGTGAFQNCTALESIEIPDSVETIEGSAFRGCSKLKDVKLSNNLKYLGAAAYRDCDSLESIKIPKSLDECGLYWTDGKGIGPFSDCDKLTKIEFEKWTTEIAYGLLAGCSQLSEVEIPDTVTKIEEFAMAYCPKLVKIEISDGVTEIGNYAFHDCTSLQTINIPDTVTSMGTSIFSGCTSLKTVHLPNIRQNITSSMFYNCKNLTTINFPSTLKSIQSSAFYGCESLKEVILPSGMETIESSAFYGCTALTKAVIPDTVTSIGSSAFYGCEALSSVTLGSSLKKINSQTFYGCTSLPSIVIPYNVESIGDSAFVNCTSFTAITIPRKTTSIASNAFSYPKKMTIYAPRGTYAQEYAASKGIKFVAQDIPATSVKLNATSKTMERYDEFQLVATIAPTNFTDEVVWTSSDEDVAKVSEDGYVETYEAGTATITVTVGSKKATCKINVIQEVTWVSFEDYYVDMKAGETKQLEVSVGPANATNKALTFTSSDTSVATISSSGVVTAKKKGQTKITATAKDGSGEYDTCYVYVSGEIKPTGITLNKKTATVKKGKTLTLKATISPSNVANKNVTWKSSNTKIATVNSSGKVTAKSYGTATITVTSKADSTIKATCKITVPYTITYKLNGGTNNSKNPSTYYNQKISLKNPTRKGYEFKGWYTDSKFKKKITTIKKGTKKNYTLYAKWEKVTVKKTSITSAKNSKSKQIAIKYKKVSGAKGYEVSYSTDKKFKKSVTKKNTTKTSYTIKSLKKGKTYYVRVRAYKIDSAGKKVYGKYTTVKKVKVSK